VQRKLECVPRLEEVAASVDLPLTHLAIGFTLAHPAVSAAIIGPRTMEQLEGLLGAAEVALDDETLDRIDEIVPPGKNLESADSGWMPPTLAHAWRRRRPAGAR
jgi:aryl-alcohol dehydrogenase-like predicted oxidoreductase